MTLLQPTPVTTVPGLPYLLEEIMALVETKNIERCFVINLAPPTYYGNSSLGVGVQNLKLMVQNGAKLVQKYSVVRNINISSVVLSLSWHRPFIMVIAR
jgi:hypothetical protein